MFKSLLKIFLGANNQNLVVSVDKPTFNDDDRQFMRRALELARQAADNNEVPVGAVLVKSGKIIGEGCNQSIIQSDPTAHAEIQALRNAGKNLNNYRLVDTTLYVSLEPCPMCVGSLIHARVSRVVFAASDLKTGACGSALNLIQDSSHNHRVIVEKGLMAEEASQLISSFFRRRRAEKRLERQDSTKN
ncbi:MAG: tRNA adenosine(34) deaminase TadA [Gammaproteobacteria bacterium]|nr:tRNA adenosine(34) deaminase TadA [Gammaproteobacteria bacterium]